MSTAVDRLDEPWRSVIQNILPEHKLTGPRAPYIDPAAVSRRLFEAIRRLLRELSQEMLVLSIDDFQWADHTTATALDFSMRRWEGGRLVLLLSARTGTDQGTESAHRLIQSCRAKTQEVELGQLETDDTVSLATAVLGRDLSPSQSAQFVALTDNIPLYIVEVAHELSEGRLKLSNREVGESFLPLPIQQIVDERLALLRPNERHIFELIVVAEELPLSIIEEIIEDGQSIVLDGLDRLMSLRLIFESEGSIHCKHELIRQGVYGRMGRVKRVAFHKRVAEALDSRAEKDLHHLALHFDRAQVPHRAFQCASTAALQAENDGAAHEAIRFLRIARRNAPSSAEATSLLAREAGVRYRQAEFDQAIPIIAVAEHDFRELGDLRSAVRWGVRRLNAMSEAGALDHTESAASLDGLLQECKLHGFWEEYVEGIECRLRILERVNRVGDLKSTLEELRCIPPAVDMRVRCLAGSVRALGLLFSDGGVLIQYYSGMLNVRGGGKLLEAGLRRAANSDALKIRYGFLEMAGLWHLESAQYELAEQYLCQAEALMISAPEVSDKVHVFGNRGEQLAMTGKFDMAREYYTKARAYLRPEHSWRLHQCVYGGLGYCALQLGELRLAHECEASIEYNAEGYFDPWMVVLFQATLLRRRGRPDGAADYLHELAKVFEGRFRMVVIKLKVLECKLRQARHPERARELGEWLVRETQRLRLSQRRDEAGMLLASLR